MKAWNIERFHTRWILYVNKYFENTCFDLGIVKFALELYCQTSREVKAVRLHPKSENLLANWFSLFAVAIYCFCISKNRLLQQNRIFFNCQTIARIDFHWANHFWNTYRVISQSLDVKQSSAYCLATAIGARHTLAPLTAETSQINPLSQSASLRHNSPNFLP